MILISATLFQFINKAVSDVEDLYLPSPTTHTHTHTHTHACADMHTHTCIHDLGGFFRYTKL